MKRMDHEIHRERIFGWVVIESDADGPGGRRVEHWPLRYSRGPRPVRLKAGEKVLGVLAAEPGTFAVWVRDNDKEILLGHEHPGAEHHDWEWRVEADLALMLGQPR